jgi:hypothetical protein
MPTTYRAFIFGSVPWTAGDPDPIVLFNDARVGYIISLGSFVLFL